MRRLLLALFLVGISAPTLAWQWPWQDTPEQRVEYCMGFLMRSLGDFPVEGLSRVQLWLAWNEVMKEVPVGHDSQHPEFQAGKAFFNDMLAAGNTQAILDQADGACAMGTG
jgi:hypothetical protein